MRLSAFYCACAFWSCVLAPANTINKQTATYSPTAHPLRLIHNNTHMSAAGASRVEVLSGSLFICCACPGWLFLMLTTPIPFRHLLEMMPLSMPHCSLAAASCWYCCFVLLLCSSLDRSINLGGPHSRRRAYRRMASPYSFD